MGVTVLTRSWNCCKSWYYDWWVKRLVPTKYWYAMLKEVILSRAILILGNIESFIYRNCQYAFDVASNLKHPPRPLRLDFRIVGETHITSLVIIVFIKCPFFSTNPSKSMSYTFWKCQNPSEQSSLFTDGEHHLKLVKTSVRGFY